ncbi:MAG TPA: c-type cytochrome domain-containing protein [Dongiaceae bacterium]|nr:c-type cytochrome domain-containing protein [Dongiaceae bacterium]
MKPKKVKSKLPAPRPLLRPVTGVLVLASPLGLLVCQGADAVDVSRLPPAANRSVVFDADIKPILAENCLRCHGPEKPKSHFRLTDRAAALAGGEEGVDLLPGNSAASPLIHYVARLVPDMEMPPPNHGTPLTAEQIGLLRAWIDQGAVWGATNPPPGMEFSMTPSVGFISVSGNRSKFREIEGVRDGWQGGIEHFALKQEVAPGRTLSVEGKALFNDPDLRVKLELNQTDLGFVQAGYEQWRRYYDDSGGYAPGATPPQYDLNRDLYLDHGHAWLLLGWTQPERPQVRLGYDYRFKRGDEATLQWGPVNGQNLHPAAEHIAEETHTLTLNVTHTLAGWELADDASVDFYRLRTQRANAASYSTGPQPDTLSQVTESLDSVSGANSVHLQKRLKDWWLLSGGYLFSAYDGRARLDQSTLAANGATAFGPQWTTEAIVLRRDAHVASATSLFTPLKNLSVALAAQAEWTRQEGFGDTHLDFGDPGIPGLFFLTPATVNSDIDELKTMENVELRCTAIPWTTLFAELRLTQDDLSQFEQETGAEPENFLRDTAAANEQRDWRIGFNTSPWPWLSLTAEYRDRSSDTDYNHRQDIAVEGDGYSAFIRQRNISEQTAEGSLVLRPVRWLKTTISYAHTTTDYFTDTDAVTNVFLGVIAPGGGLTAGDYLADRVGLSVTLMPWSRLYFTGAFTHDTSRTRTAQNGIAAVVPYRGRTETLLASANFTVNASTKLSLAYTFSQSDYAQDNAASGLPFGINFTRHTVSAAVAKQLTRRTAASLRYSFYQYSEPTSGGANDYTAHGVFATMTYQWR